LCTRYFISRIFVIQSKIGARALVIVALGQQRKYSSEFMNMHTVRGCCIKEGAFIMLILKPQLRMHFYCCWQCDVSRTVVLMDGTETKSALVPL
jgi:hypothetical protein